MKWEALRLDDIKAQEPYALVGGPFGSNLTTRDYVDDGVPVIRGSNLSNERAFRDTEFVFVSEQKADELRANIAYPGDVIFTQRGTLGQVGLIPRGASSSRYVISQSQMKLSVDPTKADARFVYYFFRLPTTIQKIINQTSTSGVPHINLAVLKEFEIPLPPLEVQRLIGDVLSTYDELIKTNGRRMELLEEAARQLYREWFVRLRFPGHEHTLVIADVPDGWEHRELGRCATFRSGGTPSKAREDFWDGDIPWVSSGELTEWRIAETPLKITAEAAEAGSRIVPRDTILAVVRGMSLAKEWRISLTSREMAFNQDLKAIVANDGIDSLFLLHALDAQRDQVRDRAGEASHGTKKLETAVLSSLPILIPPSALQSVFRGYVGPMHAQWDNLHRQNQKLRAARDLLLPRLMSGELVV